MATVVRKRLVVLGDTDSGKTLLLVVFKTGYFPEYVPTVFERCVADVEVEDRSVELVLSDTAHYDDYPQLRQSIYSDKDVILLCFSISNPASLDDVPLKWVPEVHQFCPAAPVLLIGTDTELRSDDEIVRNLARCNQHPVLYQEGKIMAERIGAWCYMECSAKLNKGVNEIFISAARAVLPSAGAPRDQFDGQFSLNSLCTLEDLGGFEIIKPLAAKCTEVLGAVGVTLNDSLKKLAACRTDSDRMKVTISSWKSGNALYPPTWKSLLLVLILLGMIKLNQKVHHYLSKSSYLFTYNEVLASRESVEMWFIRVILLGPPRLGKTTARRRLTGEIKDINSSGQCQQPSTGTVESGNVVIRNLSTNTALVTPAEWFTSKDLTDEARMFIQFFHSHALEKQNYKSCPPKEMSKVQKVLNFETMLMKFDTNKPKAIKSQNNSLKTVVMQKLKSKFSSNPEQPAKRQISVTTTQVTELFRNAVSPKYWKDIEHLFNDSAFLKMEDTGGQPEFMDMLPALTIGPALYLLFCKLTDELKTYYTVSYLNPSGESTIPEVSVYTVEEVLLSALASISCFKSSPHEADVNSDNSTAISAMELRSCTQSLAYVVGTHKDRVCEKQIHEFDEKLQQSIRSTDFFKTGLVQFASESRMVLAVDNMDGGESEIKQIQKFLENGMKRHFKKLRIPASWLVLSLCLRQRKERTASVQTVLLLAEELGISNKEATSALQFLHHYAGVLMHFPELEEMKDTVICDTQVVYDSTTNLIVNTFKFSQVGVAASERFRNTGQFSLNDISRATDKISGDFIPLLKLVKLLEHLNIIAPIVQSSLVSSSTQMMYFMPCVLQNVKHEDLDVWWANASKCPSPLFVCYQCGYVPIGVFPALVANLASSDSVHMIYDGIKKNLVQFRFGRDYDTVTLVSHPKYYAIHIARTQDAMTSTSEICLSVRQLVTSTLQLVTSRMNYSFRAEYQLGFECPSHPGRDHLCVVGNGQDVVPHFMLCQANILNQKPKKLQNTHRVWFEAVDVELTSQCHPSSSYLATGLNYASFVSSLPPCARPHLELDWGHEGVDKDLSEIADNMLHWEEKLASSMELTDVDIHDIKEIYSSNPALQRKEALRRWKVKHGTKATYGSLLEIFVRANHVYGYKTTLEVLRKKYPVKGHEKVTSLAS